MHDSFHSSQAPAQSRFSRLLQQAHIDIPLLTGLLLIASFGLFVLYSASGGSETMLYRQISRLALAFMVLVVFAQIPSALLQRWSLAGYMLGIILLVLVLIFGDIGKGAQRWLDLKFIRFQPSELMKLALPIMVAAFLDLGRLPPGLPRLLGALFICAIPVGLIAKQPDLGTSLLIASSGIFALFLAGLRWRYIIGGLAAAGAAAPILWHFFMHPYQRQRVLTFLNPEEDPLGSGYHIIQSKIAVGSGGIFGKGWLNGTQSQLDFLPERSTDFIFAVIAEEFGLLGVLPLLGLFLFVTWRGLYMASQAQSGYERMLCGSLALTFFVYLFVNCGMVTGLLPVVGVPLPLVSYGGTSMVTLMAGFGIMMSIHTHKRLLSP